MSSIISNSQTDRTPLFSSFQNRSCTERLFPDDPEDENKIKCCCRSFFEEPVTCCHCCEDPVGLDGYTLERLGGRGATQAAANIGWSQDISRCISGSACRNGSMYYCLKVVAFFTAMIFPFLVPTPSYKIMGMIPSKSLRIFTFSGIVGVNLAYALTTYYLFYRNRTRKSFLLSITSTIAVGYTFLYINNINNSPFQKLDPERFPPLMG